MSTSYREGQTMKTRIAWRFNSSFNNSTSEQKALTSIAVIITAYACLLWVMNGESDAMTNRLCKLAAVLFTIMILTRIERKVIQGDP